MLGTEITPSIDGRQQNLAIHYPDIGQGRRSVNIFVRNDELTFVPRHSALKTLEEEQLGHIVPRGLFHSCSAQSIPTLLKRVRIRARSALQRERE
jgi:hypothetical protein